ncbi:PO21 protein, partial [Syrrhaptes paradoxus]|nr:PO21 protein [Syrrhaptes paradoxus]
KAFDSVRHKHIIEALKQRGADHHIRSLITNMYENTNTYPDLKDRQSESIDITTGVKEGDPMSPLLFSLDIDPLINKLEKDGEGFQHNGRKITSLAFADDLVSLSNSWDGMAKNINILEAFCKLIGLQTQRAK